jgi:AcrR family transcriptional regulator
MAQPPRKLPTQQRSRERVDLILRSAGQLLAEKGLESLTTNAIADRAGIPIGSLYQFFGDKDQIIGELLRRFSGEINEFLLRDLSAEGLRSNPAQFVQALVTGIGRIQAQYAGFVCLFAPGAGHDRLSASADELKRIIAERLNVIFAAGLPQLPGRERSRVVDVWMDITRGMIGSLDRSAPANRSTLIEELQLVLLSYLKAKLASAVVP